jgi:hypothetical protein
VRCSTNLQITKSKCRNKNRTVTRFEDFVKPDAFEKLISEAPWSSVEDVQRSIDFESCHSFFASIAEAGPLIAQSATLLRRISSGDPPPIDPSLEDIKKLAAAEQRMSVLYDTVENTVLTERLRTARMTLVQHQRHLEDELEAVPADTLQQFQSTTPREREKMVAELFATAMDIRDRVMLDASLYPKSMKTIRTLLRHEDSKQFLHNLRNFLAAVTQLEEVV